MISTHTPRPCYGELIAVVLAGAAHVVVELAFSNVVATWYNVSVSLAFVFYVVWRIRSTPGVLRLWGLRADNFGAAMRGQLWFVAAGAIVLFVFAVVTESAMLPYTFWLTIVLYPVWGVAQQFALQNLIANNLAGRIRNPLLLATVAATLFAVSHYPRMELVALTFVVGIGFTLVYRKFPNLWAIGTAHGLLGSLVFYLVLNEDPGAVILNYLASFVG